MIGGEDDGDPLIDRLKIILQRVRSIVSLLEWQVFETTVLGTVDPDDAAKTLKITIGHLYVCRSRVKRVVEKLLDEGYE